MEGPIILFDGVCNFCNASINFIIRQDRKKIFRFAPLQSAAGQRLLKQCGLDHVSPDSFVLIENGKAYTASAAGLRITKWLPWYLKWFQVFSIVPRFIRDGIYGFISRRRYGWFGKKDQCMIPSKDVRDRFITE